MKAMKTMTRLLGSGLAMLALSGVGCIGGTNLLDGQTVTIEFGATQSADSESEDLSTRGDQDDGDSVQEEDERGPTEEDEMRTEELEERDDSEGERTDEEDDERDSDDDRDSDDEQESDDELDSDDNRDQLEEDQGTEEEVPSQLEQAAAAEMARFGGLRARTLSSAGSSFSDGSGGVYTSSQSDYYFCSEGTFYFVGSATTSGFSTGSSDLYESVGYWQIIVLNDQLALETETVDSTDGSTGFQTFPLSYNNGTFWNGVQWYITPDNPYCE